MNHTLSFELPADALREMGLIHRALAIARMVAETRDSAGWNLYCTVAGYMLEFGEIVFIGEATDAEIVKRLQKGLSGDS